MLNLMYDSTGSGNYNNGLTFPAGHITSMPFTRPTVSPKIDANENMLPKGEGLLNGSGYDGENPGSSGAGSWSYHGQIELVDKVVGRNRIPVAPIGVIPQVERPDRGILVRFPAFRHPGLGQVVIRQMVIDQPFDQG